MLVEHRSLLLYPPNTAKKERGVRTGRMSRYAVSARMKRLRSVIAYHAGRLSIDVRIPPETISFAQ